jgi:hypothetical protein
MEYRQNSKQLLDTYGEGWSAIKKSGQLRVMSGLDEDDYEEGIPDMDETTLIRSKVKYEDAEVALRQKALAKILNQVGINNDKAKISGLDIGGDIAPCMTKFDQ